MAHQVKIRYFLTFKVQTKDNFRVIVLDLSRAKVVAKYGRHE